LTDVHHEGRQRGRRQCEEQLSIYVIALFGRSTLDYGRFFGVIGTELGYQFSTQVHGRFYPCTLDSFYVIISSFLQAYASVGCPCSLAASKVALPHRSGIFGPAEGGLFGDTVRLEFQLFFPVRPPPRCKAPVWPSCPGLSSGVSPSSNAIDCPLPSSSLPLTLCFY
jgi:hypothetical protein